MEVVNRIKSNLYSQGIRVHVDDRNEKVGAKIRSAELDKIPIMLVVGENEKTNNNRK